MSQDTAAYDEVMKTVFDGGIREMIKSQTPILDMFEEGDSRLWQGRYVEYPSNVRRTEGSGFASEMGQLPTAGQETFVDTRIPCRYQYGRVQFSAQVIAASSSSRGAYEPVVQREMKGIVRTMAQDANRAAFGDGRGILCLVNGTATSATQTVDAPGNFAGSVNGSRHIRPGMIVGCIVPGTGAVRASTQATVLSVSTTGNTIVLSASVTWTDNDYVVRFLQTGSTAVGDTSYQKEFMGLAGHVDDGTNVETYHNVSRTSYPIFQSHVMSTVGTLSAEVLQRAIDIPNERAGGEIDTFVMHQSVRRAYVAVTDPDRRYQGGDLMAPDIGTKAAKRGRITFGAIPFQEDKMCQYSTIYGLDKGGAGFRQYALKKGEWMRSGSDEGTVLMPVGSGSTLTDAYEAVYRQWRNFHCEFPASCVRMDGVTATAIVVNAF